MSKVSLKDVVDALLKDRHLYKSISVIDKEKSFFIINKFLAKEFPEQAQKFNRKGVDKSLALDLWFLYLRHVDKVAIYNWFWKKVSSKVNKEISDSNAKIMMEKFDIRMEDIEMLLMYHKDFVEEEIKYYEQLKKQK